MELKDCINFLLSASQNKIFRYFSKLLEEYEVTPAQYGVLNCLWRDGQLSPKQIGEQLYLEAPTISGILDKMQKSGLIERSIDPDNRRNVLVVPTQKAEEMKSGIEAATIELNEKVFEHLSDRDVEILKKSLAIIIQTDY
ncbi:MarR family transcriptional regulator [Exiguobacterium marinum]|uniref:MarR family transcriptional regulator n=1 Tax=Exiguobacterium marinum TaxID=273528 RepID=A0ABY7WV21_9BACL|nr:MarR family transcriptional regulator [Exiguobacterium marinum]WDH74737.1 MarR family transcriptional regulator [Exiguobacterium marinum]